VLIVRILRRPNSHVARLIQGVGHVLQIVGHCFNKNAIKRLLHSSDCFIVRGLVLRIYSIG